MTIIQQDVSSIMRTLNNYKLIAVDLSKQKAFDADPIAIQQIVLQGVVGGDDNTKKDNTLFLNNQNKLC